MKSGTPHSALSTRPHPDVDDRMPNAECRMRICAIARSWIGTPYHHMGRVKGAGVDCAMLPLEVYYEAGLLPQGIVVPYYPPDWMLHRSEEIYLGIVLEHAREITRPLPGDFAMYHFGRCWAHGAIVLEWPLIVHALNGKGVILADGDREGYLLGRKKRFFTIFP